MLCVTEELLRFYVESVHDVLEAEMDFYATISPEEWLLMKPKPLERSSNIMQKLRNYLRNEGRCGNCTAWAIKEKLYSDFEIRDWSASFFYREQSFARRSHIFCIWNSTKQAGLSRLRLD